MSGIVTGNVVQVDEYDGCVDNVFSDDSILSVIETRIDYSRYYNLVVVKDPGEYYLLYYHNKELVDSFGNEYVLRKGDKVCYDFDQLPDYFDVE